MDDRRLVGLIGLGLMGEVLAEPADGRRLRRAGHDVDPAKNARLAAMGGRAAASPAEVARLRHHRAGGVQHRSGRGRGGEGAAAGGEARHGRALHQHLRSGSDRRARRAARRQRRCGFWRRRCPAPASRSRQGDGVGLIGGDPKTAEAAKPVLDALFPRRFHIGKAGDGGRAKLAVNLILGLNRHGAGGRADLRRANGARSQGVPRSGARARRPIRR